MATVCCGFNDCIFKVHSCTAILLESLKFNRRISALRSQMCLCASRVTAYHIIVAGGCVRAQLWRWNFSVEFRCGLPKYYHLFVEDMNQLFLFWFVWMHHGVLHLHWGFTLYRDWKKRKLSLHFEVYWLSSSSPHEWNESQCVVLWYVTIEAGLHCIYQNMLWFQTVAWSWNQVWTWAAQVVPLLLRQRPVLILVAWLNLADKLLGWVKEYIMRLPECEGFVLFEYVWLTLQCVSTTSCGKDIMLSFFRILIYNTMFYVCDIYTYIYKYT